MRCLSTEKVTGERNFLTTLTMTIALGIVAPLSYSVFTALGGALLLGAVAEPPALRSSRGA